MRKQKILSLVFVGVMVASLMVGCGKDTLKNPNPKDETEQTNPTEETDENQETSFHVNFAEVEKLEEDMLTLVDEKAKEKGFFILSQDETSAVVMVSSGEKPTGGYEIEVIEAKEEDGVVHVTVKETEPEPGTMVTEALTHPYTVVEMDTKSINFLVMDEKGEEWMALEETNEEDVEEEREPEGEEARGEVVEAEGIFIGAKDDGSIEILLDGEEEAKIFQTKDLNQFEAPEEDAKVAISYYSNEEGQNILVTFEVAE